MGTLDTELCGVLGIDVPIVQAPIGGGTSPALATAVADAGGVGQLSATWGEPDETRQTVRSTLAMTDGTVAVNIVVDPAATDVPTDAALEAVLSAGAEVVTFSFGAAAPYVDRVHDAGGTVMQTVGDADEAAAAADAGVDVVVAQGWEAGGHVQSEVASLPLVPRVVDAAGDVPVVAAGGIADGRGVAAVLALGAAGAWLGTRFVAAAEATAHPEYQRAVLEAAETDTEYTELYDDGWPDAPHRIIENSTYREWEEAGKPAPGDRPGEDDVVGRFPDGEAIPRYTYRSPAQGTSGDIESMALYAGQSIGLTNDEPDAATIVERLVAETVAAIEATAASVASDPSEE